MLKTAERWFELALAEENLRVQQMRLEAIQRAFTEAEDRFRLGSIPVTGTHEARASLAGARARLLAAQTELQVRRSQLADSTGLDEKALKARLPAPDGVTGMPRALELWRTDADTANPELRMLRIAADIARAEATKFGAAAAPTLDLIAQASRDRISGSGDFGSASSSATNHLVGLKATIPLYPGGYRDAKAEEAARLADKAAAEYERRRQQVAQQVQAVWLGLSAGLGQVKALAEGVVAGTARRDATQTGVQVGHRTTQNLLDAESDLASMQLELSRARVGLLLDQLRLELLAGRLDEARLQAIASQ
jgi:outer membrane protein